MIINKKQSNYIERFNKIPTNFEVAHSAHSGPYAENSQRLFVYSWAPTISTILDRDP